MEQPHGAKLWPVHGHSEIRAALLYLSSPSISTVIVIFTRFDSVESLLCTSTRVKCVNQVKPLKQSISETQREAVPHVLYTCKENDNGNSQHATKTHPLRRSIKSIKNKANGKIRRVKVTVQQLK